MKFKERYKTLLQLYRNRYSVKPSFTSRTLNAKQQAWLEDLKANGSVVIPDFLSSEECDAIKQSIEHRIEDFRAKQNSLDDSKQTKFGWEQEDGCSVWKDRNEADYRIFKAELVHPLIAAFNSSKEILDVGAAYLETDIFVKFTMSNRLEFKENNLGSGGGWHRDMVYKRGFKAMVYLTDVDEQSGPFQYLPGSAAANFHFAKVIKADQYQFTHEELLQIIGGDESKIVTCTARKGTLLLFETNMIHRGKPIESGHTRVAMTNYHNL